MKRIITLIAAMSLMIPLLHAGDKPLFPGGKSALDKYITSNLKYPAPSKENGIEGIVTIGFIVGTDGSISNAKVVKLIDPDLEKEALRLVKGMPNWEPAELDGSPIEAPAEVSIPFILE